VLSANDEPCHLEEIAVNLKLRGNELFKCKRYTEAIGLFTQAIDAGPTFPAILQGCYLNRAACNLELGEPTTVSARRCIAVI
jgi:tetratricopeptide (TPR) repeat protein